MSTLDHILMNYDDDADDDNNSNSVIALYPEEEEEEKKKQKQKQKQKKKKKKKERKKWKMSRHYTISHVQRNNHKMDSYCMCVHAPTSWSFRPEILPGGPLDGQQRHDNSDLKQLGNHRRVNLSMIRVSTLKSRRN